MGSKTEYVPMVIGREPSQEGSFFYSDNYLILK